MGIHFVTKGVLRAPARFWEMGEEEYDRVCNGAGPAGWGWLVPDTMYGLSVTEAADIHDFMYHWGLWGRDVSDSLFLVNMLAIINNKGGWLKYFRSIRALIYYLVVRRYGLPSFKG